MAHGFVTVALLGLGYTHRPPLPATVPATIPVHSKNHFHPLYIPKIQVLKIVLT